MANETALRCGVIGVGYLGQHHARLYADLPGVDLAGVCDIEEGRAREIADKYGCPFFTDPEALAAQCDALSIVVPTDRHAGVAVPLLRAGKHLLIEKPLCTSLEEAEAILAAAKSSGSIVQVGHIEHFNPVMAYLEKAVKDPRFIQAERLAPFNPRGTEVGVVLDLMIHDIGIILQLVRKPVEKIESVGVHVLTGNEDIANARIQFEGGCVANLNTSRVSLKKVREIRVFQPQAYLSLDFMNQKGHFIRKENGGLNKEAIPIEKDEPLKLELAAFTDAVLQKRSPRVDGMLGKSALELAIQVTEQIRKSGGNL